MAWPTDPLTVEVGLALGADPSGDPSGFSYTDVTAYTFDRDGDSSITITRGRQDESSTAEPTAIGLDLDNSDGRFSPRNPTGAYYPNLRRNTPLRVRVNPGTGLATRGVGFVAEWPLRWDVAEADFHLPVQANGVLRRLGQGQTPLKSALYRTYVNTDPIVYWPMEDEGPSFQIASGLPGGAPIRSPIELEFVEGQAGTTRALSLPADSSTTIAGPSFPVTTDAWQLEWTGVSDTGGTTFVGYIRYLVGDPGELFGIAAAVADGNPHHIVFRLTQNGANVDFDIYRDGVLTSSTPKPGTLSSTAQFFVLHGSTAVGANVTISHVAAYTSDNMADPADHVAAATGYAGEVSGTRFARLCDEEGVINDVAAGSTEAMGAQTTQTLLDLLRECEAAEEGLIVERLTGELGFDPHGVRENTPVALTLDYASGHVSPPLEPTDDDQKIRNDVTVTRTGGSSGRYVDEDGTLGVTAVGRYDEGVELNLYTDDQAVQHASWRVALGTVDALRFPTVTVNLRANSSLIAAWLALDIGSRIQITNLPDVISYDDVDLIVEGYTEQISQKNWVITFNCAPYGPYQVGVLAEDSMTMLTAKSTTNTSFRIASDPSFTTDTADLPVALMVDGEEVSVTGVVAVSVAIATDGTAAHADNASVTPVLPTHTEGDLLIMLAAIRNSGTGTVNSVGGWTSFANFGNFRLFNKYATSSADANPTVTFTGGAAGDTTSAVVIRARGLQLANPVLNTKTQLNGVLADIDFPYYVQEHDAQVFMFCWKQDDYTSVAPGGFLNEVLEVSTTTGNDQSFYIARESVSGDANAHPIGAHTVTGGVAAISRVIWASFLRGVVDMTVTRSVNGVVTTHAQLATVQVAQPMNLAL